MKKFFNNLFLDHQVWSSFLKEIKEGRFEKAALGGVKLDCPLFVSFLKGKVFDILDIKGVTSIKLDHIVEYNQLCLVVTYFGEEFWLCITEGGGVSADTLLLRCHYAEDEFDKWSIVEHEVLCNDISTQRGSLESFFIEKIVKK